VADHRDSPQMIRANGDEGRHLEADIDPRRRQEREVNWIVNTIRTAQVYIGVELLSKLYSFTTCARQPPIMYCLVSTRLTHEQSFAWSADNGETASFLPLGSRFSFASSIALKVVAAPSIEVAERAKMPWNPGVTAAATREGQHEKLKWLRENDCPWDKV